MKLKETDYANSTLSFPHKLYILLEMDSSDLIKWQSHGLCFKIEDPEKFADEIVPKYFKRKIHYPFFASLKSFEI
jgi:hypothetical protein